MRIDLTEQEVRTLIDSLDHCLSELRNEIIHTSTHDYRLLLKDRERVLQCLHDKLVTQDALDVA